MVLHNRDNVDLVSAILWHKDLDVHASKPICTAARFATIDMMRRAWNDSFNHFCSHLNCEIFFFDGGSDKRAGKVGTANSDLFVGEDFMYTRT